MFERVRWTVPRLGCIVLHISPMVARIASALGRCSARITQTGGIVAIIHRMGYAPIDNVSDAKLEEYALENAALITSDTIEEVEVGGIIYMHRIRWYGDTMTLVTIGERKS